MFCDIGTSSGCYVPRHFFFGKICRKSEPSADFMHVGLFPFFTFLELYKSENDTLIDMVKGSKGPGDLIA